MSKPVWANPIEKAAWMEKWCRTCCQPDEVAQRLSGVGDGCGLHERKTLPEAWHRRRNASMGDTYRCDDYTDQAPSTRRRSAPAQTEMLPLDVEPEPLHLVPVDGWPDYRGRSTKNTPEKL